jgi:hypothetical protein
MTLTTSAIYAIMIENILLGLIGWGNWLFYILVSLNFFGCVFIVYLLSRLEIAQKAVNLRELNACEIVKYTLSFAIATSFYSIFLYTILLIWFESRNSPVMSLRIQNLVFFLQQRILPIFIFLLLLRVVLLVVMILSSRINYHNK